MAVLFHMTLSTTMTCETITVSSHYLYRVAGFSFDTWERFFINNYKQAKKKKTQTDMWHWVNVVNYVLTKMHQLHHIFKIKDPIKTTSNERIEFKISVEIWGPSEDFNLCFICHIFSCIDNVISFATFVKPSFRIS